MGGRRIRRNSGFTREYGECGRQSGRGAHPLAAYRYSPTQINGKCEPEERKYPSQPVLVSGWAKCRETPGEFRPLRRVHAVPHGRRWFTERPTFAANGDPPRVLAPFASIGDLPKHQVTLAPRGVAVLWSELQVHTATCCLMPLGLSLCPDSWPLLDSASPPVHFRA